MLAGLPGRVILVPGNWDSETQLVGFRDLGWQLEPGMMICEYRGWIVFFTHEPLDVDELAGHKAAWAGARNVHGHVHGWPDPSAAHVNVSLERLDYQPRILAEIHDERIDHLLATAR